MQILLNMSEIEVLEEITRKNIKVLKEYQGLMEEQVNEKLLRHK
jgi:hypothetical protein